MLFNISKNEHEWTVYSTAAVGCLMLQCGKCGAFGTVDDPTYAEWSAGFYAPEEPYRWYENERVNIRKGSLKCSVVFS